MQIAASAPPPESSKRLFFRVFPSIMLPMFIAISDQTLVSTALPAIAADLGRVSLLAWIVVAYLMTNTLSSPVYGRLGDMVGRRHMMLIALAFVVVGATISVTAVRIEMLILGRAVQGIGGGGLMSLSHAMIGQMVPLRDRGRFQGYLAAVATTATIAGPMLGGLLTQHFGWRAALAMSIPLALIAMVMALRLPKITGAGRLTNFDGWGLGYFAATVLPVLFAIQQLQRVAGGERVGTLILLLAIAAVALVLLARRERRAASPLFSLPLLAQPAIWRSACVAGFYGAAFVSLVSFTPLYLRVARDLDTGHIGLLLLTLTIGVGFSSLITGQLISRTGRTLIFPSIGLSVLFVLLVVFAWVSPMLATWQLSGFYFAMSLCFGTVMGVLQVTVQHAAGPTQLGAAASAVQFSRSLGASVGTSLVGAAVFVMLQSGDGAAADYFRMALEGVTQDLAAANRLAIRAEMVAAFRPAFLTVAGFIALASAMAWSVPVRSLEDRLGE